ncbi:MAG: hypothetical protein KGQ49_06720, partial [Verrucomicrobia bacterium]|nr:hypothetical protein [Verrucomicrobiota bacterium]
DKSGEPQATAEDTIEGEYEVVPSEYLATPRPSSIPARVAQCVDSVFVTDFGASFATTYEKTMRLYQENMVPAAQKLCAQMKARSERWQTKTHADGVRSRVTKVTILQRRTTEMQNNLAIIIDQFARAITYDMKSLQEISQNTMIAIQQLGIDIEPIKQKYIEAMTNKCELQKIHDKLKIISNSLSTSYTEMMQAVELAAREFFPLSISDRLVLTWTHSPTVADFLTSKHYPTVAHLQQGVRPGIEQATLSDDDCPPHNGSVP